MKIRTKRTALSVAVASLFVFTPLVHADQYTGGTTDSFTTADTGYRFYYLYSTNNYGVNPEYGVTYTDVTGITNGITLNFSDVSTTGSTFQVFALQVDDSYGTNSVTTSGITLNISNADLEGAGGDPGSGGEMYMGAVFNTATGTPGALTIGDITMTAENSTISGDFIGYFQRAGGGETGATVENSGVVNVGNISITSSGTTLGTGIEDAVMAGAYIGYTSGFNVTIGTGTEETPATAISVTTTNDDESSAVFGMRLRYDGGAGTTNYLTINGDIDVSISGGAEGASTYGFSDDETNANITTVINGNISVDVENAAEATTGGSTGISSHRLDGIFESGSGSNLTVNGDVSVTVIGLTEEQGLTGIADVRGAFVTGATAAIENAASMTLNGNIDVFIEGVADISSYVAGLESGGTTVVTGDITVTHIAPADVVTTDDEIDGNIYGVYQTGGNVTVGSVDEGVVTGGNVIVNLGGTAELLGDSDPTGTFGTETLNIYGTLNTGTGTTTIYGSRTLNFGTEDTPFYSDDGEASTGYGIFEAAFGGFDEVVIASGSSLYIDGSQATLTATADGITSSGGTLTLSTVASTMTQIPTIRLTVQSDASLTVPIINNDAGNVHNYSEITATTVTVGTLESGTALTSGNFINYVDATLTVGDTMTINGGYFINGYSGASTPVSGADVTAVNIEILSASGLFLNGATVEVSDSLTLDGGSFINYETGEVDVGNAINAYGATALTNMGTASQGTVTGGTITTDALNVTGGDATTPAVVNSGTLNILAVTNEDGSSIGGYVSNTGQINIGTSVTQTGTQIVTITADGTLDNSYQVDLNVAAHLAVAGTMTNSGSLYSAYGDDYVIVDVSGTFTNVANAGYVDLYGALNITGAFINGSGAGFLQDGTTTVSSGGSIQNADGTAMQFLDLEVTNGSVTGGNIVGYQGEPTTTLNVAANGTVSGVVNVIFSDVTNAGSITDVTNLMLGLTGTDLASISTGSYGILTNSGTTNVTNLVAPSSSTINAYGGTITVANLTSDGTTEGVTGVIYNQTGGTIAITASGWFTDSTLNIMGGEFNTASYSTAPDVYLTGQTTSGETVSISGKTLGTNTVNISGTGVVTTEIVDSTTKVTVSTGGSFYITYIDPLDLDATAITLDGGTIFTTLDQIFEESTEIPAIEMDGETDVTIDTELFEAINAVGDIRDTIQNGLVVTENGGTFSFSDDYSQTEASSAVSSLQDFYNNSSVTAVFTGHLVSGSFDVDAANTLIAEGEAEKGYAYDPGVILATVTLINQQLVDPDEPDVYTGNTLLSIGETSESGYNVITEPGMGFMDISGADGVVVQEKMKFVLVGDSTSSYSDKQLLLGTVDGGYVNVNGTFTLGTNGVSDPTSGWIGSSSISETGELIVKNGEFAVWTIDNEKGGTVTVDENAILHTASLTSNGNGVNNGQLIFETALSADEPNFTVGGTFENYGTITADGDDTTKVKVSADGFLDNLGTLTSINVEVSGEVSNNEGATWTTSDTLTVSANGGVGNGGVMTITTLTTEAGSVVGNNGDGTLTVSGDANVAGTLENEAGTVEIKGTLTLENDPTLASAELINTSSGVMTINALVAGVETEIVNDDGSTLTLNEASSIAGVVTNEGTITAKNTLTIEEGADVANAGTMTASTLSVESGAITSSNTLTADSFTITDGSLSISGGTFTTSASTLTGGMVCVGFDCSSNASPTAIKPFAADDSGAITVELSASGNMGSQVYVANGSKLNLGTTGGIEWADDALGNLGISYSGDLLVMRSTANIVDSGTISVGSQTENGGLYFAGDSTLVVDVNSIGSDIYSSSEGTPASSAVFVTTGDNTTVTVDSGATLVLVGDLTKEGRYDITQGYTSELEGWKDSFTWGTEDGTVYGLDSSGVGWELAVKTDGDDGDVYVVAVKHDDISDNYDVSIPNIVNEDLNDCSSSDSASIVCGVLRDDSLTKEEKEKTINSMSNLLFAGGVMATTMTDATAAIDSIHNHLTMDSDTFGEDGDLWPWDRSNNLWIDALGSWQHGKHLDATKISGYQYKANSYGFILGYDYKLPDRPVVLGGAFSFSDGELKSKGSAVAKTKNEYQTYGVHLFGNYSPSSAYNIIGSLHWLHNSADIKQSSSAGKAKAKVQTNLWSAGVRGETTIKAGSVNIVPHVEARYLYSKSGKFTTKLDGTSLWKTKAKESHIGQFPVGVAARTDIKTDSGWNFRPNADISVIPQVGNTKQRAVVTSNGVSDTIDGQFMGKFGASAKVGLQADKGNATVGLKYGFTGGTKGRADHSVILQGRYRF